jgi:hypothetical protein
MSGESTKRYFKKKEKKDMKDGLTGLRTQGFMMKKEKITTVTSLVTQRINGGDRTQARR